MASQSLFTWNEASLWETNVDPISHALDGATRAASYTPGSVFARSSPGSEQSRGFVGRGPEWVAHQPTMGPSRGPSMAGVPARQDSYHVTIPSGPPRFTSSLVPHMHTNAPFDLQAPRQLSQLEPINGLPSSVRAPYATQARYPNAGRETQHGATIVPDFGFLNSPDAPAAPTPSAENSQLEDREVLQPQRRPYEKNERAREAKKQLDERLQENEQKMEIAERQHAEKMASLRDRVAQQMKLQEELLPLLRWSLESSGMLSVDPETGRQALDNVDTRFEHALALHEEYKRLLQEALPQ